MANRGPGVDRPGPLFAPELLRPVTAVLGRPVRLLGCAAGEPAVIGVRRRT